MALGNKKSVDDAAFEIRLMFSRLAMALGNQASRIQWHWEIKKAFMLICKFVSNLLIAPDANEPITSPVEDADLIAPHPNTFFKPALLNWNWDDVIVIPSDDDEANENSNTNINSYIIDVHVDVEELARATTAKLDRIWVDLVRKETKSLLDIIDAAEHRIESDTNVVEGLMKLILQNMKDTTNLQKDTRYTYMEFQKDEMVVELVAVVVSNVLEPEIDDQILSAFMELDPVFNPADVDADVEGEKMLAEMPPNLVASYKEKDFSQTFVSINNFQVGDDDVGIDIQYLESVSDEEMDEEDDLEEFINDDDVDDEDDDTDDEYTDDDF
ncbi:hypothetical protein Tco_0312721 [Tanacetum coccineum]